MVQQHTYVHKSERLMVQLNEKLGFITYLYGSSSPPIENPHILYLFYIDGGHV